MKRYLYHIVNKATGFEVYDLPYMPRVLAERYAKELNRQAKSRYKKVEAVKTMYPVKDGSPDYKKWIKW